MAFSGPYNVGIDLESFNRFLCNEQRSEDAFLTMHEFLDVMHHFQPGSQDNLVSERGMLESLILAGI